MDLFVYIVLYFAFGAIDKILSRFKISLGSCGYGLLIEIKFLFRFYI